MTPSLFGPLAAFVAVLALIPFALWLLKRSPLGAGASANGMRVVSALPLAPNQRVVTVEVGSGEQRQWLVLGVTPAGIRTLHTLAPQADAPAATPRGGSPFAQLLSRQQRPAGDGDAR